ncbi:11008_t:CDS:1, partial [Paraglomus brasilianum]
GIVELLLDKPTTCVPELWLVVDDWKRPYIYKQVENFKDKIHKEDEPHLLARKYMYYSKDLKKPVLTTVGAVMEDAVKQLKTYIYSGKGQARDIL